MFRYIAYVWQGGGNVEVGDRVVIHFFLDRWNMDLHNKTWYSSPGTLHLPKHCHNKPGGGQGEGRQND